MTEAVAIWNEVCGPVLAQVRKLTPQRSQKFRKRLAEDLGGDLNQWRTYCEAVVASTFLTGGGDRGWKADFDWLIEPKHMTKILEGGFQDRKPVPATINDNWGRY